MGVAGAIAGGIGKGIGALARKTGGNVLDNLKNNWQDALIGGGLGAAGMSPEDIGAMHRRRMQNQFQQQTAALNDLANRTMNDFMLGRGQGRIQPDYSDLMPQQPQNPGGYL